MTASIASMWGVNIPAVLDERAEYVVDMIAYAIEKAEDNEQHASQEPTRKTNMNDGFWDF